MIIYNQELDKWLMAESDQVELADIGLSGSLKLEAYQTSDSFALVYAQGDWRSMTYGEWEILRMHQALNGLLPQLSEGKKAFLEDFVARMTIKYQGKKSWQDLLAEMADQL